MLLRICIGASSEGSENPCLINSLIWEIAARFYLSINPRYSWS